MGIQKSLAFICLSLLATPVFAQTTVAPAVEAPKVEAAKPGISYKGVNVQLGGFLASEMVYRSNNTASDIATAYAKMPFQNSYGYGNSEFRGTERQSRFSLLATGDVDSTTHLAGYYETDFLGTGPTSNANQSNSYSLRTRNIYATSDWDNWGLHVLAGQNWSLLTLNSKGITPRNEVIPQTIDAQYVVGFEWSRQWQMRVVKDWDKRFWLALSAENAQTVGVAGTTPTGLGSQVTLPGGALMPSTSNYSLNSYPDFVLKFAWESTFGHYEIAGIASNFEGRYGSTNSLPAYSNEQSKWGEGLSVGATIPVWPKKMDLSITGMYGNGLGRYGTSQLPDATYASDGSITLLPATMAAAQLVYHVDPKWEVYVAYGFEGVGSSVSGGKGYGDGATVTGGKDLAGNTISDNSECGTTGGICTASVKTVQQINAAAWWSFYKGSFGQAKLGLEAAQTWLTTYADAAGNAPNTHLTSLYTSLRYYPF